MKTLIDYEPFAELSQGKTWPAQGFWRACWIQHADLPASPFAVAYRRRFDVTRHTNLRIHVSGDERYALYLDGELIGRGSEYGDADNWYFETYDLALTSGAHTLVAVVWTLGELGPYSQISVRHGFICAQEDVPGAAIETGAGEWDSKLISGLHFVEADALAFGTGANLEIDAATYSWGVERGEGDGWHTAVKGERGTIGRLRNNIFPSHLMRPAVLPAMVDRTIHGVIVRHVEDADGSQRPIDESRHLVDEALDWAEMLKGVPLTIAERSSRQVLLDLGDYYCTYPHLTASRGAGSTVSMQWAESLYCDRDGPEKGHRDEINGKYFRGVGDVFKLNGENSHTFHTLWWRPGRYLRISITTADEPVVIDHLELRETRYPLEMRSKFECDDRRYNKVVPIALRSLQMCAHELFFDCPYYEQMMYSGDSRLAALTTMSITQDDRLVTKAIDVFDYSRLSHGITQSRYPCRVRQTIVPFSLFWVGMIHDYALWRGDRPRVLRHMATARGLLETILAMRNDDGLIDRPPGWNFIDWVPSWPNGEHPGMDQGPSGILNLQLIYILRQMARVESWLGETDLQMRWERTASQMMSQVQRVFWNKERGLFASDPEHQYFAEHAQCFAVLSGLLNERQQNRIGRMLVTAQDLDRVTISYTHYLFEAYRQLRMAQPLHDRMRLWLELPARGFKTTPEQPEPTRSDCHGWSSHIIHHYLATVAGIRPGAFGFDRVHIEPMPGSLKMVAARLAHPRGVIDLSFRQVGRQLIGNVTLPAGTTGTFTFGGVTQQLTGGMPLTIGSNEHPTLPRPCHALR